MRIGKAKQSRIRVLIQEVTPEGKTTKSESITVYEATLVEVRKVVETALNQASKK